MADLSKLMLNSSAVDNGTDVNQTTTEQEFEEQLAMALHSVQAVVGRVLIITLFVLGTVGNALLFYACMQTKLRRQSYSYFLLVLVVFDSANLFISLLEEIARLDPDTVFHSNAGCKAWKYFDEVCGFMSWWLTASLSCERFMILYHPLQGRVFCGVHHVVAVIAVLSVSSLGLHVHFLTDTVYYESIGCHQLSADSTLFANLEVFFYKVLGYFVPAIIIVTCNCFVVRKVDRVRVRVKYPDARPSEVQCRFQKKRSEVTVMLLIITSVSVVASIPSQVNNFVIYLGGVEVVNVDFVFLSSIYALLNALTMVSYSCNFYAYILFSKFRKQLRILFKSPVKKSCTLDCFHREQPNRQTDGVAVPVRIAYNQVDQQRIEWNRQLVNYQYQVWLMNTPNKPLLAVST